MVKTGGPKWNIDQPPDTQMVTRLFSPLKEWEQELLQRLLELREAGFRGSG